MKFTRGLCELCNSFKQIRYVNCKRSWRQGRPQATQLHTVVSIFGPLCTQQKTNNENGSILMAGHLVSVIVYKTLGRQPFLDSVDHIKSWKINYIAISRSNRILTPIGCFLNYFLWPTWSNSLPSQRTRVLRLLI